MSSESSGKFDEISEQITEDRGALLTALSRSDSDERSTTELRREAGIPSGSMSYHMQTLVDLGLVEVVGETDGEGTIPANVYSITSLGQEFLDSSHWRSFPTSDDIERLENHVSSLEDELETLKDVVRRGLGDDLRTIISEEVEKELEQRER